jgi:hypothetical protein
MWQPSSRPLCLAAAETGSQNLAGASSPCDNVTSSGGLASSQADES